MANQSARQADSSSDGDSSVDLAYALALKSYEIAQSRFDLMNGRIQILMTIFVTLALAVPAAINILGLELRPFWGIAAVVALGAAIASGTWGLISGQLITIEPGKLYEHFLGLSPIDFKRNFIRFASCNLRDNKRAIDGKWRWAVAMSFFFAVAVGIIAFAISPSPTPP